MKATRTGHWHKDGRFSGFFCLISHEPMDKGRSLGFAYLDPDSSRWAAHDAECLNRIGLYPTQDAAYQALELHLNVLTRVDG